MREWLKASSHTFRAGRLRVTVWPRSFPWLVQWNRRQWWIFDRASNPEGQ